MTEAGVHINMNDLCPEPFPAGLPTIKLAKISLAKLLNHDEEESQKIFENCKDPGFFYLDLTDDPTGKKILEDIYAIGRISMDTLPKLTVEEKKTFKTRDRISVLDTGYFTKDILPNGEPRYSEMFNIPQTELFATHPTGYELPPWLAPHTEAFRSAMRSGNALANLIFEVLERCLKLPAGTITSAHKLGDASSDFLRMLRYAGYKPGNDDVDQMKFPAHKDAMSLAILFTWIGGLQMPGPDAEWLEPEVVNEESWRWVEPLPGYAIINIGDALEILTNKVLKSGLHRIVRAPGAQAPFDKYSVLIATRPKNTLQMLPFKSPMIPELTAEKMQAPVMTSEEWGTSKIKGYDALIEKRKATKELLTINE